MDQPGRIIFKYCPATPSTRRLIGLICGLFGMYPALQAATPEIDESIRLNRMGTLIVLAAPGTAIHVEQTRHEFWFGAAVSSDAFDGDISSANAARYRRVFLANFNAGVTEDALKWGYMEPKQGKVDYTITAAILDWADQNHIPLRGHNIFWGVPEFVPNWLKPMNDASLRKTLEARARDIGARYRGRFVEYDLNNEMLHGNYFAERLGPGITFEMARWVREEDPSARLFVNDYDIETGNRLADYVAQIRGLLRMGVPLAGIGIQGHSHAETFDHAVLRHALDELAQFHLPIRVTEFLLPGQLSKFYQHDDLAPTPEEEETKAREIVDYYRICFSHPAVIGIMMWGFWSGTAWIPAASLYRQDWTPTPAALAFHDLIFKEWWTRWQGQAGPNGRCEISAFYGTYQVTAGDKQVTVELRKKDGTATVSMP